MDAAIRIDFDTLQRLHTLPTPWSTWPRDPIRLDQRRSNETCLTRDSPIVPPAFILPRSPALGGPYVLMTPATVMAKQLSQTGTPGLNTQLGSQGYRRLPDQGSAHA